MNKKQLNTASLDGGAVIKKGSVVTELNNQSNATLIIAKNGNHEIKAYKGKTGMDKVTISTTVVPQSALYNALSIYANGVYTAVPESGYNSMHNLQIYANIKPKTQTKTVDYLPEGETAIIVPDAGYDALSEVTALKNPPYPYVGVNIKGVGFISAPKGYTWGRLISEYKDAPIIKDIINPYEYWDTLSRVEFPSTNDYPPAYKTPDNKVVYTIEVKRDDEITEGIKYLRSKNINFTKKAAGINTGTVSSVPEGATIERALKGVYDIQRGFVYYRQIWDKMPKYGKVLKPDDTVDCYDVFEQMPAYQGYLRLEGLSESVYIHLPENHTWREFTCDGVVIKEYNGVECVYWLENNVLYRLTSDENGVTNIHPDSSCIDLTIYYGWLENN